MTDKILLGKKSNITDLEEELLDDIKDAGVFGGRTIERIKASNIVKATYYEQGRDKQDISKFRIFLNTAFPSADALSDRYVDAKKHKVLLPVAWCQRIVFHFKQKKINKYEPNVFEKANAVEKRIILLKRLGLINNIKTSG